jgi:hypothetical protein
MKQFLCTLALTASLWAPLFAQMHLVLHQPSCDLVELSVYGLSPCSVENAFRIWWIEKETDPGIWTIAVKRISNRKSESFDHLTAGNYRAVCLFNDSIGGVALVSSVFTAAPCSGTLSDSDAPAPTVKFTLSPNPAKSSFRIHTEALTVSTGTFLDLTDLSGRKVLHMQWTGPDQEIQIGHLEPGMYMARILENDIPVAQQKIILLHP